MFFPFSKLKHNNSAFTLIELLVVIAIIALLSTISIISLNGARAGARDARRLSDIKQMQTALELYYANVGSYPTQNIIASGTISDGVITYMKTVPTSPTPADGACGDSNNYAYSSVDSGASYTLSFCIGKTIANGPTGATTTVATPLGMISGGSGGGGGGGGGFTCGTTLTDDRDTNTYPTVLIGTQCWMAKNLAWLPSVVGPGFVGNEDTTAYYYVYGYDGTSVAAAKATANYSTYGVLYNNVAAMSPACPASWHLPSDNEQNTLDQFLKDTTCDANRNGSSDCASAGGKLKETGTSHWNNPNTGATNSSGFTALAAGYSYSGSFEYQGTYAIFWSSSVSGSSAWTRTLHYGVVTVDRYKYPRGYGISVRCLKD